jgi:Tol biopolymer transport system component
MRARLLAPVAALLALVASGCGDRSSGRLGIMFLSDRDGGWALYAMSADGGAAQRMVRAGQVDPFGEGIGFGEPLVSPDGRAVMLARRGIAIVSLATGKQVWHGAGEEADAAWSPDARRIVFGGAGFDGGMFAVDLRSGRRRTLFPSAADTASDHTQIWTPAWSPDGRWIAFERQVGAGQHEVDVMHPDGSGLAHLTDYTPWEGRLAWSRNGRLAFVGVFGGRGDRPPRLVVADIRSRRVEVSRKRVEVGPVAWSPDSQRIAISGIDVFDADARHRRSLTATEAAVSDTWPIWSPDGKSLVFVRTPLGRDADAYIARLWTVRADGSHAHPLTHPFPDGGTSMEPAWVRGPIHVEPARRPTEMRGGRTVVLRVPYPVDGISAASGRAAIAPLGHGQQHESEPTPPILIWRPGRGNPRRLSASPCGIVNGLVLASDRIVFDCGNVFFDESEDAVWVAGLRTLLPHAVFEGSAGPGPAGLFLNGVAGTGRLVAFATGKIDQRRHSTYALWRLDGFDSINIHVGAGTTRLVAAADGLLATELGNGDAQILRADGTPLRVLGLRRRRSALDASFRLADGELLVLEKGLLRAFSTADGKLRWQRRVPANATLEAAAGGLIVYASGSTLHVLERGRDTVVRTSAQRLRERDVELSQLVHAALGPDGLYYCYDVHDVRFPGRVVFVPRAALPE